MSEGAIPSRERADEQLPDRKIELKRDGASWLVTADDAVIGRLERVASALANLGKSKTSRRSTRMAISGRQALTAPSLTTRMRPISPGL